MLDGLKKARIIRAERRWRASFERSGRRRKQTAHRSLDFSERDLEIVFHLAGIGHVTVNAFLKFQRLGSARVVALPVFGTVRPFAPIFFDVVVTDTQGLRGRFVEASEVTSHHQEVGTHG